MLNITLADYRVGNLHSLKKALEMCGAKVEVVTDMSRLLDAECIAFPGVGAFDMTMDGLIPYKDEICARLETGTPGLGICIGTQILMEDSKEGTKPGLGFIKGHVEKVPARQVPQMGWNSVETFDPLMDGIESRYFYFANSYYCCPTEKYTVKGTTEYEGAVIPTLFRKMNFVGTQFHPEKSSTSGLRFLSNFVKFAEGCL
jgi:glutamine amidotransferase